MTDRRFALAEHLLGTKPWDLFAMVEMGTDRIHHGFWKYMDPEHRKYEPGNRFEDAIRDYYRHIDGLLPRLLEFADDDTAVLEIEPADTFGRGVGAGVHVGDRVFQRGIEVDP